MLYKAVMIQQLSLLRVMLYNLPFTIYIDEWISCNQLGQLVKDCARPHGIDMHFLNNQQSRITSTILRIHTPSVRAGLLEPRFLAVQLTHIRDICSLVPHPIRFPRYMFFHRSNQSA